MKVLGVISLLLLATACGSTATADPPASTVNPETTLVELAVCFKIQGATTTTVTKDIGLVAQFKEGKVSLVAVDRNGGLEGWASTATGWRAKKALRKCVK